MVQIAKIEVSNFRGIRELTWVPNSGMNCLIGPGDSGKSTVLQAVDWCIGSRRSLPLSDADFHGADVAHPIRVTVTLSDLDDRLRSLDSFGLFLRGFKRQTGDVEDEPEAHLEDALSVRLTIADDLDPTWSLVSDRAAAQGVSRDLSWRDRQRIAPAWIGSYAARHLSWRPGSILARISDEQSSVSRALADAARNARGQFGTAAAPDFKEALCTVRNVAATLGISGATNATAMLDALSVSPTEGAISLHDDVGVPLRNLGLGSARLLIAGLQGRAGVGSSVVLIDEVEHGLEPHRIAQLLVALGAKSDAPTNQVFMTTHSPAVLRELVAAQIHVVRSGIEHQLRWLGDAKQELQGPLRRCPEAFLGTSVLVCEGATEVGLIRGMDLHRLSKGQPTFMAAGGVLVDAGGVDKIYGLADSFAQLEYHTAVLRDDDRRPNAKSEKQFRSGGGRLFHWGDGLATEDELFASLPRETGVRLCRFAQRIHGRSRVVDHIRTAQNGPVDLDDVLANRTDLAPLLAKASKLGSWFKRISTMEEAARSLVGPALSPGAGCLQATLDDIFAWAVDHAE